MRLTGKQVIEQSLALLGSYAPGELAEERLVDQGLLHANAQLESLALESQYIPGETIQTLQMRAGVGEYWLGPEFRMSGTPDAPVPPYGLRTSGVPDRVVRAAVEAGRLDAPGPPVFYVARNAEQFAYERARPALVPGTFWLFMGDGASGPGPGVVEPRQIPTAEPDDPRSFVRGSRKLEVLPAPGADVEVRLYLRVPEITLIERDHFYEFPMGVGQVLMTQIAASLATVYGVDPDTRRAVEERANHALSRYKRKNARFRRNVANLPRKWLGTVSDDERSFETREVYDR